MATSLADLLNMEFAEEKKGQGKRTRPVLMGTPNPVTAGQRMTETGAPVVQAPRGFPALVAAAAETVLASAVTEMPRTLLALAQVRLDGDTQPRGGLNEERVSEYAQNLEDGEELPPVDVVFDGENYWLWDGFHRVEGSKRKGRTEIAVKLTRGTLGDAQWLSYSANKKHGLNRTSEDKARAVQRALRHPKGVGLSNREIARHCGVDEKTVRNYREKMEATAEIPQSQQRIGGDGRTINTGKIGSQARLTAEIPQSNALGGLNAQRPSRYGLPAASPSGEPFLNTSTTETANESANPSTPGSHLGGTRSPISQPEQYAPIFLLEQRVQTALRTSGRLTTDPDMAAELRQLNGAQGAPRSLEFAEMGKAILGQLDDLQWRRNDLVQAINNVASQIEQRFTVNAPTWPAQATTASHPPAQAQLNEELLHESAAPLTQSERQAAIAGEVEYWQGALLRLAVVGTLTGQHTATLALRREIDKVIALYQQENGV